MTTILNELVSKTKNFVNGGDSAVQAAWNAIDGTPRWKWLKKTKPQVVDLILSELEQPKVPQYMLEDARKAEYDLLNPHG